MSEPQYSPPPWHAYHRAVDGKWNDDGEFLGWEIGGYSSDCSRGQFDYAMDAHMAAAAPTMYQLLKRLGPVLEDLLPHLYEVQWLAGMRNGHLVGEIRDVLDKIEGNGYEGYAGNMDVDADSCYTFDDRLPVPPFLNYGEG